MARMVDFYTRFLGFAVADRGPSPNGEIVFLTRDPREHHQFVLVSGRPADLQFNIVNQLSFRVDSLATLKELHEGLRNEAVAEITTLTHGNALSCYFRDPEKNRVELLIDTPWYVPQPHRLLVDLSCPTIAVGDHRETCARRLAAGGMGEEIERKIAQAGAQRRRGAARVTAGNERTLYYWRR
jgi:catechol 2,3-dioxygenase-like lactoylglutathione lyase family enzyme